VTSTAVVGASLAGLRTAEALRRGGDDGEIVLIGAEPHQPYDRPPLSKQVLDGRWEPAQATLRQAKDLEVTWRLGVPAASLDVDARLVHLADGHDVGFDRLVIATGASPRTLPGTEDISGVFVLRTLDDCLALGVALRVTPAPRVCVIGAGFIGSEVASSAHTLGLEVTVVEAASLPLGRVFGPQLAALCGALHAEAGVSLRLGLGVHGIDANGSGEATGIRLADGSTVPADVVVVGIGVTPTTGWLAGSGLAVEDGVRCDPWLRALDEHGAVVDGVVAVGDVCRWDHPVLGRPVRVEHWSSAVEQAATAATTLLHGPQGDGHAPIPYVWSDQYDHKLQVVGHTSPEDEVQIVEGDIGEQRFIAALGRDGRLVGAFGMDMPGRIMGWRNKVAEGAPFPVPPPEAEPA
jgi:3-phenylpropionate/trans-cinnamate dioxygenase ferredoxin reductase subunit